MVDRLFEYLRKFLDKRFVEIVWEVAFVTSDSYLAAVCVYQHTDSAAKSSCSRNQVEYLFDDEASGIKRLFRSRDAA